MANATIRPATLEDKRAVLAINDNVFGGRDYLPALYDHLVGSPSSKMFVFLQDDKIIAFGGVKIVDGGQTGAGRGARVNPEYVGLRLGRQLMYHCVDWSKTKGVIRSAATEIQYGGIERVHENYRIILSKILLAYKLSVHQLRLPHVHNGNKTVLSAITDKNLSTYFASEKISSYLFPHKRILVNATPYRLMESNIPLILENSDITKIYTNVESMSNDNCTGLVSIGTVYPVRRPSYAYNIEIYGEDRCSLESHIVQHLRHVMERTTGDVSIHVATDENMPQKVIDKVMSKYGIRRETLQGSKADSNSVVKRVLLEMEFYPQSRY